MRFFFQVRRNEAIFCIIGFGIGISCCLVYRWFKSSLFGFFNFKKSNSQRFLSTPCELKHSGLECLDGLNTQFQFKSKPSHREMRDFKSKSVRKANTYFNKSWLNGFNAPLNGAYVNFSNFKV